MSGSSPVSRGAPSHTDPRALERRFQVRAASIGMLVSGILLLSGIALNIARDYCGVSQIQASIPNALTATSSSFFVTFTIFYAMNRALIPGKDHIPGND